MTVAVYMRVSTEEQAREGYSIAAQERACREYCRQRGWDEPLLFVDEGKSAHSEKISKRPAFRQMMVDAEAGLFDMIIVHKLDRFSRHLRTTLECFERLAKVNVAFVSISESIDYSTPTGRLFLAMLGALAQWYSDNLATETRKGKQERKRQGLYNGLLPFGVAKGDDGIPIPHPHNYAGLLLGFEAALEASDAEVARQLNAAGYRTSGNRGLNLWTKDSVRVMLTNRFYLGELPGGVPGKHKPFIDAALFEAVQAARARRRHNGPATIPPSKHVYSLSGLLRCGYCLESGDPARKGSIRIHAKAGEGARTRCYSRTQGLECEQRSRWLSIYEAQIGSWLEQIEPLGTAERIAQLAKQSSQPSGDSDERRRLETRLANIRELYGWGDITREAYLAERGTLTTRLQQLAAPAAPREDLRAMAEAVGRAARIWRHGTPADMHELMSLLVQAIVIKNGAITEIIPNDDAAALLPSFTAKVHSSGSDGGPHRGSARYAEPHNMLPPALLHVLAGAGSVRGVARRYGVARQTVRRARTLLPG